MNIFVLDKVPKYAAAYLCDKHIIKMQIEYAQLLSVYLRSRGIEHTRLMKDTHKNHPCTLWVMDDDINALWLASCLRHVLDEYTARWDKAPNPRIAAITAMANDYLVEIPWTLPYNWVYCMPDMCKLDNIEDSYRLYYLLYKRHFAKWSHGPTPAWYTEALNY